LDRAQARVLALQEPSIRKSMKPKLFGLIKGKTRQQATAHLENAGGLFGKYHLAKLSGCIEVSKVEDLYKLALLADTRHVVVSADVASLLIDL
jgi:hypothetical protein